MDKKTILGIFLVVAVLFGGIFWFIQERAQKTTENEQGKMFISENGNTDLSQWKTYINTTYDYSVKYPDNWYVDTESSEKEFTRRGPDEANDYIGGDTYFANYPNFSNYNLANPAPADLFGVSLMIYRVDSSLDYKHFFSTHNYEPGREENVNVNGIRALKLTSLTTDHPVGYTVVTTLIKVDDKMFVFNYSGKPMLEINKEIAESIVGSFSVTQDTVRYENSTIGLAFDYPKDWLINEAVFSDRKGDIMKDGKIYTNFGINISPKNWDSQKQSDITVNHYPYISQDGTSFDNIPVNEQLALIDCAAPHQYGEYDSDYKCDTRKSKNGVTYVLKTGYIDQVNKGYGARAMVPTGKYILTFSIMNGTLENYKKDLEIFEKVVSSVELE